MYPKYLENYNSNWNNNMYIYDTIKKFTELKKRFKTKNIIA